MKTRTRCSAGGSVKRGRFSTNITTNLAFFLFNTAINLWLTPYLIRHLGTASYGLIPLAMTVTSYMAIVTLALNAAVARYMTIALERDDHDSANQYFNTSLFGSVFVILAILPPVGWAVLHAEMLVVLPPGEVIQGRWLLGCTVTLFLLTTLRTPFEVSTYCLNRFDLRNLLLVSQKLVYVGIIAALFSLARPQIRSVGFGMVGGAVVALGGSVLLWRVLTPALRLSIAWFNKKVLRNLLSFGGWVSFNAVGSILFLGIELVVVNRMFGPDSGGRYATVLQWSVLLRGFAGSVAAVFGPTILYHYAQHDIDALVAYVHRAIKFLGIVVGLPVGLVCGLSHPLLETWVGPEFADLSWLMSLMTIHLCVNLSVMPLYNVQTATNRVRWPAIVTFFMGVINLGLAVLLAGPVGWGLYGVAGAGGIVLTAKNMVFTPIYNARVLGQPSGAFSRTVVPIVGAAAAVVLGCKTLAWALNLATWGRLAATAALVSLAYAAVSFFLLLTADDRKTLRGMVDSLRK